MKTAKGLLPATLGAAYQLFPINPLTVIIADATVPFGCVTVGQAAPVRAET
jgi:hypothetical protein